MPIFAPIPEPFKSDDINSIREYFSQLMSLLKRYHLIHTSHPDRFFEIVVQQRFGRLPEGSESRSGMSDEDLQNSAAEIAQLCAEFKKEIFHDVPSSSSEDALPARSFTEVPLLIHRGPQHSDLLRELFSATERLKLLRRHVDFPRPMLTLLQSPEELGLSANPPISEDTALARQTLLGRGMCHKKQHEVVIMHDAMRDLLHLTAARQERADLVIMNVGEGKGYVSRVLNVCEGAPVIGLDCNPLHKEVALKRMEPLIDVNSDAGGQTRCMLNLLYRKRGLSVTVTNRISASTDWTSVLSNSVPVRSNDTAKTAVGGGEGYSNQEGVVLAEDDDIVQDAASIGDPLAQSSQGSASLQSKVQCIVCQKIMRCQNAAGIIKHSKMHFGRATYKHKEGIAMEPSEEKFLALTKWTEELSPVMLLAKVMQELFTSNVILRNETVLQNNNDHDDAHNENDDGEGPPPPRRHRCELPRAAEVEQDVPHVCCSANGEEQTTQRRRRLCVVGFNDGNGKYKMFVHHPTAEGTVYNGIAKGKTEMMFLPMDTVKRLAPVPAVMHPVCVPGLENVSMMGLHTCGDLGATICKSFVNSNAPSMLLVSCCWHALTQDGFPLCKQLSSDPNFSHNSLSLMLATQPLDMWGQSGGESHLGSCKLLFFRSLFAVMWDQIRIACAPSGSHSTTVSFDALKPHLGRPFLRSLVKDKTSMSFAEFCTRIGDVFFVSKNPSTDPVPPILKDLASELARGTATSAESVVSVLQQYFMCESNTPHSRYIQDSLEIERVHVGPYFVPFVGFTIMRMWLSHLLEGLLLMDRLLYLYENTNDTCRLALVPLFDGALSPRLFGIAALR